MNTGTVPWKLDQLNVNSYFNADFNHIKRRKNTFAKINKWDELQQDFWASVLCEWADCTTCFWPPEGKCSLWSTWSIFWCFQSTLTINEPRIRPTRAFEVLISWRYTTHPLSAQACPVMVSIWEHYFTCKRVGLERQLIWSGKTNLSYFEA